VLFNNGGIIRIVDKVYVFIVIKITPTVSKQNATEDTRKKKKERRK
jgi:hypothetical protein